VPLPDVHFGEVGPPAKELPPLDDDADDDEDIETPQDVVELLGVDPAELFDEDEDQDGAEDALTPEQASARAKKAWLSRKRAAPEEPAEKRTTKPEPVPAPRSTAVAKPSAQQWPQGEPTAKNPQAPGFPSAFDPKAKPKASGEALEMLQYYAGGLDSDTWGDLVRAYNSGKLKDKEMKASIASLENLADSQRTSADAVVYRGITSFARLKRTKPQVGAEITLPGFASTSGAKYQAEYSLGRDLEGGVMTIKVPAGSPGIDVNAMLGGKSPNPNEREFLLQNNSKFKVISYDPRRQEIGLELIVKGAADAESGK
jgi:hypothetical protein